MLKIIFLTSFIFVSSLLEVEIPYGLDGILKKGNNEYLAIHHDYFQRTDTYKIKIAYDNVTVIEKKSFYREYFDDQTFEILIVDNNLIFYGLLFNAYVENNGKFNEIIWPGYLGEREEFLTQAFSNDCLLICTWINNYEIYDEKRFDFHLHLVKAPYVEVSKNVDIYTFAIDLQVELIGLKDYFAIIKIDKDEEGQGNITYKFVDFELNLVNTFTHKFEDYLYIYFFKLSNSGKVNKFLLCILKKEDRSENLDTYKCQVMKYENNDLSIIQTLDIPIIGKSYSLEKYCFDENKIVFYIYDIYSNDYYDDTVKNDYIYIFQYESPALSFYKNFNNLIVPKFVHYYGMYYFFSI